MTMQLTFGEMGVLLQQIQQIFLGHGEDSAVGFAGDGVHQGGFFVLKLHDLLLDGVLSNELVHLNMGLLPDLS